MVALVEVYPVFDFRPMTYLAALEDLPIRGLLWGHQGVALGIVYRNKDGSTISRMFAGDTRGFCNSLL